MQEEHRHYYNCGIVYVVNYPLGATDKEKAEYKKLAKAMNENPYDAELAVPHGVTITALPAPRKE